MCAHSPKKKLPTLQKTYKIERCGDVCDVGARGCVYACCAPKKKAVNVNAKHAGFVKGETMLS